MTDEERRQLIAALRSETFTLEMNYQAADELERLAALAQSDADEFDHGYQAGWQDREARDPLGANRTSLPPDAQSDAEPVATVEKQSGRLDSMYSDSPVETWYVLSVAGKKFALWSRYDADQLAELFNIPPRPDASAGLIEAAEVVAEAERYRDFYPPNSDGFNTFEVFANKFRSRAADRSGK